MYGVASEPLKPFASINGLDDQRPRLKGDAPRGDLAEGYFLGAPT